MICQHYVNVPAIFIATQSYQCLDMGDEDRVGLDSEVIALKLSYPAAKPLAVVRVARDDK